MVARCRGDRLPAHGPNRARAAQRVAPSRRRATVSVGYDHVDVEAATRAGVAVCNTPGVLVETTADLAFALILAASRVLGDSERDLRRGGWERWELDGYLGRDVHGATLGLVGYGRIGKAVARRAEGFSMQVIHYDLVPTGQPGYIDDLDELLGPGRRGQPARAAHAPRPSI